MTVIVVAGCRVCHDGVVPHRGFDRNFNEIWNRGDNIAAQ
jgi:hypothetical protein